MILKFAPEGLGRGPGPACAKYVDKPAQDDEAPNNSLHIRAAIRYNLHPRWIVY
jgi:hypothetical protein